MASTNTLALEMVLARTPIRKSITGLLFAIIGRRLEVLGAETIDPGRNYLIVANHPGIQAGFTLWRTTSESQQKKASNRLKRWSIFPGEKVANGTPYFQKFDYFSGDFGLDKYPDFCVNLVINPSQYFHRKTPAHPERPEPTAAEALSQ